MAGGHDGGLDFLPDGTIRKRTNATELAFYLSIYEPSAGGAWELKPEAKALGGYVPVFYGHGTEENETYIRIGNLTNNISNPKIMDVKIGTRTASKKELTHTGMSAFGAWTKRRKLQVADWWTKSAARGYRVVDAGEGGSRSDTARADTSEVFRRFFENNAGRLRKASEQVGKLSAALANARERIQNVFISSSVLFCYGQNLGPTDVKLLLIDFGHTHAGGAVPGLNEEKYQEFFNAGLNALQRDLDNAANASDLGH